MAFKMKAGKKGPMYKNFPSAFKADIPEVTVEDKKPKTTHTDLKLKRGYLEKDGKYYNKPMDPSFYAFNKDNEVSRNEATKVVRKK
tara:strand:+ start:718 stop:975 length:258 start_codon:yes stop_codon:yes gene_type:complete